MESKLCRSCGVDKPLSDFRHYYGGRKGHYSICRQCESIDTRRKYLMRKSALTDAERRDLENIQKLYDKREASGLRPPTRGTKNGRVSALISALLEE